MAIYSKLIEGLTNGEEHFVKVFTVNHKSRVNNRIDLPVASVIPSAFPAEPSSYNLIGTYSSSQTFTAPEDGYYQIEVFGASGNGGNATFANAYTKSYSCGGGGGSGAYCCSVVKLKKGDTIIIAIGAVGAITSCTIKSSCESYTAMQATSGANGGNAEESKYNIPGTPGIGGLGGIASGGNVSNVNGTAGSTGQKGSTTSTAPTDFIGGSGGAAVVAGSNPGGNGQGARIASGGNLTYLAGSAGLAGFCKIYRGDTNVVAA